MAEAAIPNIGNPRVDAALARIRGKFTDLENALMVFAERDREHAADRLTVLISGLAAEAADRRAKDAVLDARVERLLNAIRSRPK